MAVFVSLGAILQGYRVMKTIGKGIILSSPQAYEEVNETPPPPEFEEYFPGGQLPDLAIFVALISAGVFVSLATYSSLPVSTSQSIVGGVAGVGIGIVGFQGGYFKMAILAKIFGSWVLCPFLTMILAFIVYFITLKIMKRLNRFSIASRILGALVIISACYSAYSLGANDVGNAIGPLLNKYPTKGFLLAFFGAAGLALGALTFSRKVCETVGKNITPLNYAGAFSAQISGAFGIHLFSMLGIPVSTSQAIVGAVIGVGLVKGSKAVSRKMVSQIISGWVLCPLGAAIFAAVLYRLLAAALG